MAMIKEYIDKDLYEDEEIKIDLSFDKVYEFFIWESKPLEDDTEWAIVALSFIGCRAVHTKLGRFKTFEEASKIIEEVFLKNKIMVYDFFSSKYVFNFWRK